MTLHKGQYWDALRTLHWKILRTSYFNVLRMSIEDLLRTSVGDDPLAYMGTSIGLILRTFLGCSQGILLLSG